MWARGALVGLLLGAAIASFAARETSFDAFLRVASEGVLLLDLRGDESELGRLRDTPLGALGQSAFSRRSWFVATSYTFTLTVRPEISPRMGQPIERLQVSVALPGRVTSSNATRMTERAAVWDGIPPQGLRLETRTVHWARIALLAAAVVALVALARRA